MAGLRAVVVARACAPRREPGGVDQQPERWSGLGDFPAVLRRILKDVRAKGYAAIQDELDYGIVSVSLPIFGPHGRIVAAANCSDVTNRFNKEAITEKRLPTLRRAVRRIENMLAQFPELAASVTFDLVSRMPAAR